MFARRSQFLRGQFRSALVTSVEAMKSAYNTSDHVQKSRVAQGKFSDSLLECSCGARRARRFRPEMACRQRGVTSAVSRPNPSCTGRTVRLVAPLDVCGTQGEPLSPQFAPFISF